MYYGGYQHSYLQGLEAEIHDPNLFGLEGLGLTFTDLPNGGHNLRLYTNDTASYVPGQNFMFNTGHYDVALPQGPCANPDAQGFNSWTDMATYAGNRGESLVLVTRADLTALCAYRPPVQPAPVQPAPYTYTPPTVQPYGYDTGSTSVTIKTGGPGQPSTPPPVVLGPPPSAGIDTGGPISVPVNISGLDSTTLMYLGIGVVAFLALRGRRQ